MRSILRTRPRSAGTHTHDVDPALFSTAAGGGAHDHQIGFGTGDDFTVLRPHYSRTSSPVFTGTTGFSGGHQHGIDVPNTTSTSAGFHSHDTDVPAFTSGSTGAATVDVTMPYLQLRACRKD
jgi:hypothetical protein